MPNPTPETLHEALEALRRSIPRAVYIRFLKNLIDSIPSAFLDAVEQTDPGEPE